MRFSPLLVSVMVQTAFAEGINLPYTRFQLANGLEVIVHEDHSTPVVAVNLWFRVGSKDESPGRTGFAHLFEHVMFKGSKHVPDGAMDVLLEEAGGSNNATTSQDRTNYFETVPSNFLELALWLESDRLGWLLDAMDQPKLDNQRDVVRNERRQRIENRPYGMDELVLYENVFPPSHPYHHPVIGSHEDLEAARLEDVRSFFQRHYVPNRVSLVIAGDVEAQGVRALCEKWFGEIPSGVAPHAALAPSPVRLTTEKALSREDRVELARLYVAWPTSAIYAPGDAEMDLLAHILAGGKSSRLYRSLVYEKRIAQDVSALQESALWGSLFVIAITAKPGHSLERIRKELDSELQRLRTDGPTERELERAINQIEASFLQNLEHVDAKADLLNQYRFYVGDAGFLPKDLARYRRVRPADLSRAAREQLVPQRVILHTLPAVVKP